MPTCYTVVLLFSGSFLFFFRSSIQKAKRVTITPNVNPRIITYQKPACVGLQVILSKYPKYDPKDPITITTEEMKADFLVTVFFIMKKIIFGINRSRNP